MTDINKTILEKSRLVLLDSIRMSSVDFWRLMRSGWLLHAPWRRQGTRCTWSSIRQSSTDISDRFHPVLVKISPALDESSQLQYLKKTKDLGLVASIVSDDCRHSPFGLIIHTDHPSGISPTDMSLQYPNLFEKKKRDCQSRKEIILETSL